MMDIISIINVINIIIYPSHPAAMRPMLPVPTMPMTLPWMSKPWQRDAKLLKNIYSSRYYACRHHLEPADGEVVLADPVVRLQESEG